MNIQRQSSGEISVGCERAGKATSRVRFRWNAVAMVAAVLAALITSPPAHGESAPDLGQAFEPTPRSEPKYGTKAPDADPPTQRAIVKAADGVDLYVETWLPALRGRHAPPKRMPTILIMTPYVKQGVEEYPPSSDGKWPGFIEYMTARGFAVAQHHVRGTGESGGCLEQTGPRQIDDGARVIEYLGGQAPWSNRKVGMYGISYDAETQISVAGLGDPAKTKYLKAIVPVASVGGQYEYSFFDGVPYTGFALNSNLFYLTRVSLTPGDTASPGQYVQKLSCQPEVLTTSADHSGDFSRFWQEREYRPGSPNVTAATLYVHGLLDWNVQPLTAAGWFDRLPATTPHKGIFGVWDHAFPDRHNRVQPDWARADWLPMVTAWFDRYLKELDTGVEQWPAVQVQASDGQWRAEPEFPSTGGPTGRLALSADGRLGGVAHPRGTSTFREGLDDQETLPGTSAVFTTPQVNRRLHISGQPVADLWLITDRDDAHLTGRLEVIGADGQVLRHAGSSAEEHATYGLRSLRHLEPMPDGYFIQQRGKPAPIGAPIRVSLRFHPTDLVVPVGGRLRLTMAGATYYAGRDSQPSGNGATITLLHDCTHSSALRFVMARPGAPLLNVREHDELNTGPLTSNTALPPDVDGGGLATAEVCG